ncbi:MAG: T9SS type A sorting domain-containing protein [Bacteroidales bacterium]
MDGKEFLNVEIKNTTLDISALKKGLYFIQVQSGNDFSVKKLVVN